MGDVAYVARGQLHLASNGKDREFESPFAAGVRTRAEQIAKRNAWKMQGPGARLVAGFGGMPDGDSLLNQGAAAVSVSITGLARSRTPREVLYTQQTDVVSGLFTLGLDTVSEQRLYHHNGPILGDPSVHPSDDLIALSVRGAAWTSHLALSALDGRNLREITEGDVVDCAPSWVPGERRTIVYQSSGIGRDPRGLMSEMGCAAIHKLDLERGDVSCLLEDAAADFVGPRMTEDGSLFAVRRPRAKQEKVSPLRVLGDVALLPFRLGRAVFNYLEFFSVRYSGKPLMTAHGTSARHANLRRMLLAANMIDATRNDEVNAALAEASRDWSLVKLQPGSAKPEVVVDGVTCFDITPTGDLLYADGSAIHRVPVAGGAPECVCTAPDVVAFVGL